MIDVGLIQKVVVIAAKIYEIYFNVLSFSEIESTWKITE
jgi:hypothetical protein